jgi:hypothetical protein
VPAPLRGGRGSSGELTVAGGHVHGNTQRCLDFGSRKRGVQALLEASGGSSGGRAMAARRWRPEIARHAARRPARRGVHRSLAPHRCAAACSPRASQAVPVPRLLRAGDIVILRWDAVRSSSGGHIAWIAACAASGAAQAARRLPLELPAESRVPRRGQKRRDRRGGGGGRPCKLHLRWAVPSALLGGSREGADDALGCTLPVTPGANCEQDGRAGRARPLRA